MFTNSELQISNKSYTNKDFQTIYPEIMETIKKLTDKWDPSATNESDPLIVYLKLLGFIADKLNYNVDKNILEASLPSATQESSFRNLLERDAYTMRYYQSATTKVIVEYKGDLIANTTIDLPLFDTQFSNEEDTIRYTLVPQELLTSITASYVPYSFLVVEGAAADLNVNGITNIQLDNLDDNNRIFFPIQMIAENGIYVKNIDSNDWLEWKQVNNLNTQQLLTPCFKFGYDSDKNLPYIEFPQDIASLIGNGLNIKYIKTDGYAGNIESNKLVNLASPSTDNADYFHGNAYIDAETGTQLLRISNKLSAINGADPESLDEAYNNFKKTTGTFDVLVTVRDFANYLYNYVPASSLSPLFSNIQVCDRRNDINYSIPYKVFNENGVTTEYYLKDVDYGDAITHNISPYDLVPYPLKITGTILDDATYNETFKPSDKITDIPNAVEESQAICHTYVDVQQDVNAVNIIYAVLNEYALNAKISTVNKVGVLEGKEIIANVKKALYDNFNSRKIDYGYEIPYDSLLKVMENADPRIKLVNLDEPVITPKYLKANGNIADNNSLRNQVIARNVLAGKVELYDYDRNFNYDFGQSGPAFYEGVQNITTELTLINPSGYVLTENQIVQLVKDKYVTETTAVYGVNFLWVGSTLNPDIEHTIGADEHLYLSWTDSNNNIQYRTYGNGTIIRPNFDLGARTSSSLDYANIEVDASKFPDSQPATNRFDSLQSQEEIAFVKKAEVTLNKGSFDCYWFRNNANNELFPSGETTITLQDGEYFIYADSTHSNLEILGGGTRLERTGLNGQLESLDNTVSKEVILSGDSTALNELNWQRVIFNTSNTLTFIEQVFLTLNEGYKISYQGNISNEPDYLVEGSSLTYYEPDSDVPTVISSDDSWKVYTILALNAGPNKSQSISEDPGVYVESITITYGDSNTVELPSDLDLDSCYLTLNEPLHIASIETIDLSMYTTEEGSYLFNACSFNDITNVEYNKKDGGTQLVSPNSQGFRIIAVNDVAYDSGSSTVKTLYIDVPTYTDKETYTYIYWKTESTDVGTTLMIPTDDSGEISVPKNKLCLIDEYYTQVNTQLILQGTNLSDSDEIIISPLKIINIESDSPKINSDLGIDMSDYTNAITALFGSGNEPTWYSTLDVANDTAVNELPMTGPYALFDKDNVANRMTIAKIDFSNSNISIVKSSLL